MEEGCGRDLVEIIDEEVGECIGAWRKSDEGTFGMSKWIRDGEMVT